MQITVRLFGALRDKLPRENKGRTTIAITPNTIVQDVLDQLGIDDYVIIAINDQQAGETTTHLNADDTLLIFEPAAGG